MAKTRKMANAHNVAIYSARRAIEHDVRAQARLRPAIRRSARVMLQLEHRTEESEIHFGSLWSDSKIEADSKIKPGLEKTLKSTDRLCLCCSKRLPVNDFPSSRPTKACVPACDSVCSSCMAQWLSVKITEDTLHPQVNCPMCQNPIEDDDVPQFVSSDVASKYTHFRLLAATRFLQKDPQWFRCLSPTCVSGQIHEESNESTIFTCQSCGFYSCYECCVPWHPDESCENVQERLSKQSPKSKQSEALMEKSSKMCPNSECKTRVTKISGCNHMHCELGHFLVIGFSCL